MLFLRSSAATFIVLAICACDPSEGTNASVGGKWKDASGLITITQTGSDLSVKYDYTDRGPFAGQVTGASDIEVTFDANCCTGNLPDNNTIKWSNGSSWARQ
jgi:hypothetical protein